MIYFFYASIVLVIALFFIVLGLLSFLIRLSTDVRSEFVSFILEDNLLLSLFGLVSLLIGLALAIHFFNSLKKRYIKINSQHGATYYLDEGLLEDYMKNYWQQLFPQHDIPSHMTIKKNQVSITADLPYVPENQQKALLARIDEDLKDLFNRLLGYHQEYIVSISFQTEEKGSSKQQK